MPTMTNTRQIIACPSVNGNGVWIGFDSGDRDEVGTAEEIVYLRDATRLDQFGIITRTLPAYGVLARDTRPPTADELVEYIEMLTDVAEAVELAANHAVAALANAGADLTAARSLLD